MLRSAGVVSGILDGETFGVLCSARGVGAFCFASVASGEFCLAWVISTVSLLC